MKIIVLFFLTAVVALVIVGAMLEHDGDMALIESYEYEEGCDCDYDYD